MRAPWAALHAQLMRSTDTLMFQKRFSALRQSSEVLRPFPDPAALFDHLHGPGGDAAARNAILTALVVEAQQGDRDTAVPLLMLALWPGLDAVHRRLARHFRAEPDLLVSEVTGRITDSIHRLDLSRVNWIAATLIRNTERDIRRSAAGGLGRGRALRGVAGRPRNRSGTPSVLGLPDGLDRRCRHRPSHRAPAGLDWP